MGSAGESNTAAATAIPGPVPSGPISGETVTNGIRVVAMVAAPSGTNAELMFLVVGVVAAVIVVVVIVAAVVGMCWCYKKKRKAESERQMAEQDNAIATLRSAVAAPMMDPNLSANEAMKIWQANGLMLN